MTGMIRGLVYDPVVQLQQMELLMQRHIQPTGHTATNDKQILLLLCLMVLQEAEHI